MARYGGGRRKFRRRLRKRRRGVFGRKRRVRRKRSGSSTRRIHKRISSVRKLALGEQKFLWNNASFDVFDGTAALNAAQSDHLMGCKIGGPAGGTDGNDKIGEYLLANKLTVDMHVRRLDSVLPGPQPADRKTAHYRFCCIWDKHGNQDSTLKATPTVPSDIQLYSTVDPGTATGPTPVWYAESTFQRCEPFRHPLGYGRYKVFWMSRKYSMRETGYGIMPNVTGNLAAGTGTISTSASVFLRGDPVRYHRLRIRFPKRLRKWYRDLTQTGGVGTVPYQFPVIYFVFMTDWDGAIATHHFRVTSLTDVFSFYDP